MATQVEKKVTRWTTKSLLDSYRSAWKAIGQTNDLSPESVSTLVAQSSVECGRNGPSCFNYNVSNIMGVSQEGLYHFLAAPECGDPSSLPPGSTVLSKSKLACGPGKVAYLPPGGGSRFRAYTSFETGCTEKLSVLAATWPKALNALATGGDLQSVVYAYARALLKPRYFSADEIAYRNLLMTLAGEVFLDARGVNLTGVAAYQQKLIELGYDLGPSGADGVSGPRTVAAVRDFQSKNRLVVDGKVGPATLKALGLG